MAPFQCTLSKAIRQLLNYDAAWYTTIAQFADKNLMLHSSRAFSQMWFIYREKKGNCISLLLLLLCALAGRALASESSYPEQIANVHCVTCNFIFFCKHEKKFNFALDVAFVFSGRCFPFHIGNFLRQERSTDFKMFNVNDSLLKPLLIADLLLENKLHFHERLFRWQWKVLLLISCHCSITGKRILCFFSLLRIRTKKRKFVWRRKSLQIRLSMTQSPLGCFCREATRDIHLWRRRTARRKADQ